MSTDPVPVDDEDYPSPKDFVARRRFWTFIIAVVVFSAWLRFEWSQGGITPLFGPLHIAVHEGAGIGGVVVMCAIWIPLMLSCIAQTSFVSVLGSIFFTMAWLFFGFFWFASYV